MTVTVFVPRDSAARSVGADEVADRISLAAQDRGVDVRIVRNGSRGMLWLEPLVEITTDRGRVGYGPVTPAARRLQRSASSRSASARARSSSSSEHMALA